MAGSARRGKRAVQIKKRLLIGLALVTIGLTGLLNSAAGPGLSAGPVSAGTALETAPSATRSVPARTEQEARDTYAKLPLAFVPNAGQTDRRVRFSADAGGASFYFTPKEAVFAFTKGNAGQARGVVLRLAFLGANAATRIEGQRLGTGRINYFIGSDPAKWRTNLPAYGQVVYHDLWPGVDMVFRGDASRLKYEFVLRPGANVEDIQLSYRGADRLSVDRAGQLLIGTPLGTLQDARPLSYQKVGGRRVPVESRFLVQPDARHPAAYGFAVGAYDATQPLVIDPGLLYSTYLGGNNSDLGNPIAVDAAGSAYVTGETESNDFPTTAGAFDTSFNGNNDAFVTKLNATGSALVYSTYLGGSGDDRGHGIALDAGNAYITGETESPNFPTTLGAFDTSFNGNVDAFVTKLNATGSAPLLYSTYLGGSNADRGFEIADDGAGGAYVTGQTAGGTPVFPTTVGAFDTSFNGQTDVFVTKLNATGSAPLSYSTFLGGAQNESGDGIAVDGAGSAYVTGRTAASAFPTTAGAFDTSHNGGDDVFVTKLNATGSAPTYSTFLGDNGADRGFGITFDASGSAYVTGETQSNDFPTTLGAFDTVRNGNDAFVTKLNATGTAPLSYSTFLGGTSSETGFGIALDSTGNAYVTGETTSTTFPTTVGAFDTSFNGNSDAFVTKLNATGSAPLSYSTFLGGSNGDMGQGIAVDAPNSVYVTGETNSGGANPFPTTAGAFDTTFNTDGDAFVTKLDTVAAGGAATLAINDVSQNEGNAGTTPFTFTVTRSGSTTGTSTVAYATANNSATGGAACAAGIDYVSQSGTLTFAPTVTSQTITILVCGETTFEPNETFFVNLTNPTGATITDGQGQGTIVNDDAAPTLAINDVTQNEGNIGPTLFIFTVTKSGSTAGTATVDYATDDGTADGGAACVGSTDYVSQSGTISFAPAQTTQTITILVCGDTAFEPNETFFVNLTNPVGATIADAQGLGTIVNDDAAPTLSINDVSQNEGNVGPTPFTFTVTRSGSTASTSLVNYQTANNTATGGAACAAGVDYVSQNGTLVFAPTVTSQTITILVCADTTFEPNETFFVNLFAAVGATIADSQGVGTIVNDDAMPTLSINDVSQNEGNVGTTPFTFTVTKSGSTSSTATVDYATDDGTADGGAACVGSTDYVSQSGTLTFAPTVTSLTITILVCGDTTFEPNETFFVNLSNPMGATVTDAQGLGTIVNDDDPPTLSIDDVSQNEGHVGTTPFTFTVTKTGSTATTATVDYATDDGTADGGAACAAGIDYVSQSGTLTFAPLTTTQTITILVCGDLVLEPNETFFVDLSNPTNATIADGHGIGTIVNDEVPAFVTLDPPAATNTVGTEHCVTATVTDASANPIEGVTVRFSVTVSNPTTGSDVTDADGDAEFCYTGTVAGGDAITAFADTERRRRPGPRGAVRGGDEDVDARPTGDARPRSGGGHEYGRRDALRDGDRARCVREPCARRDRALLSPDRGRDRRQPLQRLRRDRRRR